MFNSVWGISFVLKKLGTSLALVFPPAIILWLAGFNGMSLVMGALGGLVVFLNELRTNRLSEKPRGWRSLVESGIYQIVIGSLTAYGLRDSKLAFLTDYFADMSDQSRYFITGALASAIITAATDLLKLPRRK